MVDRGKIQRPSYAVASVDNALRLIQILRDTGELRVSTASNELGMAVSTVHRLLALLVYHGFAIRDDSKAYLPGPALGAVPVMGHSLKTVRNACLPHLELLSGYLNETVTLHFRVGSKVRFLDAVESTAVLRIGSQRGVILDARSASGGKALLAEASLQTLERLYRSRAAEIAGEALNDADFEKLLRQLEQVRRDGYARNFQETAAGVCAIGMSLHSRDGNAIASFSVAVPAERSTYLFDEKLLALTREARRDMEAALAEALT